MTGSPRIGRVQAAQVLPTLLRAVWRRRTWVRCLKCDRLTTRRLDRDVGIHEECER